VFGKTILHRGVVDTGVEVLLNFVSRNFLVRASPETSSMDKNYQRRGAVCIRFPKVDHMVRVITIRNILIGYCWDRGLLLSMDRVANYRTKQKDGE
jgi:hypothetical protein